MGHDSAGHGHPRPALVQCCIATNWEDVQVGSIFVNDGVLVKLMHTLTSIDADGFLGLLSDEGTMREDLQSHNHDLLERMRAALQREAAGTVVVVGQSQLGLEAVESFVENLDKQSQGGRVT